MTQYEVRPYILRDPWGFFTRKYYVNNGYLYEDTSVIAGNIDSPLSLNRIDMPTSNGWPWGNVTFPVTTGTDSSIMLRNVWRPKAHAENIWKLKQGDAVSPPKITANIITVYAGALAALFCYYSYFSEPGPNKPEFESQSRQSVTLHFPNGAQYVGPVDEHNRPDGQGVLNSPNGQQYSGRWDKGCYSYYGQKIHINTDAASCGFTFD